MKIIALYNVRKVDNAKYIFPIDIGRGSNRRRVEVEIIAGTPEFEKIEKGKEELTSLFYDGSWDGVWVYKDKVLFTDIQKDLASQEDLLRMRHFLVKKEKELNKIAKEVEAFENFDKTQSAKREKIPDNVRLFVWQRDEGKCVKCSKKERLEFDHIIPVVEGGANTERNVQLLCESCNRSKGKSI